MARYRRMTLVGTLLLLALLTGPGLAFSDNGKKITWHTYDEGVSLGKKEGKKIFMTFYANWCGYCKKMDQTTFSDPSVIDYLAANYITIKINSDQEKKLAATYRVSGLPTHWFLDSAGGAISSLPGYLGPEQFLPILKYIQTESYKTVKFDEYIKNNPK